MDKDSNQASESQATEKAREGLSRRRLLKAGAAGAAVVPVMVTIKSTSAQATGLVATPAHLSGGGWDWNWDGHDHDGTKTKVYGSVACIQRLEMPPTKDHAIRNICDRHNIEYYSSDSDGGIHHSGFYRSDTPTCTDFRNYFYTTDFGPYCTYFDPSNEHHCTYMEIMLSTACLNSIKGKAHWSGGTKTWSGCGNDWYHKY